jgi:hypothetical protein
MSTNKHDKSAIRAVHNHDNDSFLIIAPYSQSRTFGFLKIVPVQCSIGSVTLEHTRKYSDHPIVFAAAPFSDRQVLPFGVVGAFMFCSLQIVEETDLPVLQDGGTEDKNETKSHNQPRSDDSVSLTGRLDLEAPPTRRLWHYCHCLYAMFR